MTVTGIIIKTPRMSEEKKRIRIIEAIKKKAEEILPKGSRVALYGSRARGDNGPESDWDLHVLVPGEEKLPISAWDSYGWLFEQMGWDMFDEWIIPRVYSVSGWLKRSFLPFYKNVEKDKIIIFQN